MQFILIIIGVLLLLGLIAAIAGYIRNRKLQAMLERGEIDKIPDPQEIPQECCGQHETCERDSLLAAVSKAIEYYDDEELDRYKGIESDAYEEEAVDEFRDVLFTLQEVEVAGWLRSLQLRGINLPDALKDEAFLIVGERRFT
ncbi:MAG: phospholipase [Parabacteroides sp.]